MQAGAGENSKGQAVRYVQLRAESDEWSSRARIYVFFAGVPGTMNKSAESLDVALEAALEWQYARPRSSNRSLYNALMQGARQQINAPVHTIIRSTDGSTPSPVPPRSIGDPDWVVPGGGNSTT